MKAIEYLVVGKEADTQVVIHISCMQSKFASRLHLQRDGRLLFGNKDVSKAFLLLLTIRQDHQSVALQLIVFECLAQKVEVFME